MKTALQELIDWIECDNNNNIYDITDFAKELLEKEKEQIKEAFKYGWNWNFNAEEYYNQTYNQEPKKEYQPSEEYLKKQRELMEDFVWNKMNNNNQNK